jgi:hypothetical protein
MRCEIVTAVTMKNTVFLDRPTCNLVGIPTFRT